MICKYFCYISRYISLSWYCMMEAKLVKLAYDGFIPILSTTTACRLCKVISVAISSRNRCITSAVSRFWCTAHTVHVAHSGKLHYLFKSELLCFCKLCSTQVKVYTVQFVHHLYNGYLFYFKQISYRELSVYGSNQICSLYWQ